MPDALTAHGVGRMLPGSLGGYSQIVSAIDTARRRKREPRCNDEIGHDAQVQTGTSTSITITGWSNVAGEFPGPGNRLMVAWLIVGSGSPTPPAGWTVEAQTVVGGKHYTMMWKIADGDTGVTFTYPSTSTASVVLASIPFVPGGVVMGGSAYSTPSMVGAPTNPNSIIYSVGVGTTLDMVHVWIPAGSLDASTITEIGPTTNPFTILREIGGIGADRSTIFVRPSVPRTDVQVAATTPAIRGMTLFAPRWRPC